jgi:YfiR/HmsC-like
VNRVRLAGRVLVLALGLVLAAPAARAQNRGAPVDELAVKVAFLYNFMLFTQWPTVLPDPVRLCVLGSSPLDGPLRQLNGRPLAGQNTLAVLNVRPGDPLEPCNAVYIDDTQRQHTESVLARLRGLPVLTVTDGEGLAERGVMIEIRRRDLRLGFEVNLEPSTQSRLQFSSRMLKLASHVNAPRGTERPGR